MRGSTIRMGGLVALLVCAIPASTQTVPPTTAGMIERAFADIETQRMNGDCAGRDQRLAGLANFLTPMLAPAGQAFSQQIKDEYRTRLTEAAAQRCPAGPPPPPPFYQAPSTRTKTVDDFERDLTKVCGPAFEPSRQQWIAALDRAIYRERDASRRARFERDRARAIATPYRECRYQEPSATSPRQDVASLADELTGACGDSWSVLRLRLLGALDRAIAVERNASRRSDLNGARGALLRRDPPPCEKPAAASGLDRLRQVNAWLNATSTFDTELLAAERARFAGSCTERTRRIGLARAALERIRSAGYAPPTPGNHAARLTEQLGRRCTPKREATTTAAAPVLPGGLRMCRAIDYQEVRLGRPITCRCERVEQYLSVWGSNPYSARSTICNAAVHAGVLPSNGIGVVRLMPVPQSEPALGSLRNGISSSNWDLETANGFTFSAGGSVSR